MTGMRMQWIGISNPDGWAGKGIGAVIGYEENRLGFGDLELAARRRKPPTGPACCLKLDHNGLSVWLSPDDLKEIADDPDDLAEQEFPDMREPLIANEDASS